MAAHRLLIGILLIAEAINGHSSNTPEELNNAARRCANTESYLEPTVGRLCFRVSG